MTMALLHVPRLNVYASFSEITTRRKRGLVIIQHHVRPLRGVTKFHFHSDHVRRLHSEKSDKWPYMKGSILCWIILPLSSKQRTMSTSVEVNEEAIKFMLTSLAMLSDRDGNRFHAEYTCRPCFAKLSKGSRHYRNNISLISELTAPWATGSIATWFIHSRYSYGTPDRVTGNQVFELLHHTDEGGVWAWD